MSKANLLGATSIRTTQVACGSGNWLAFRPGEDDKSPGESIELLHGLFESPHVRLLDTSNNYGRGESERRIGIAIREYGGLPDGFVLQTKADRDMTSGDFSGQRMRDSLEESRDRLGLETLPVVYLHDPENTTWEAAMGDDGPVAALVAARESGIIGHLGISGGPAPLLARFVETGLFEALITHNRYTLVDRGADALISLAAQRGLGVLNASPYGGGLLTSWPVSAGWYAYDRAPTALVRAADRIGALCADAGVPLAAAALHWSLRDPRISSTIVGMRTVDDLWATESLLEIRVPDELWSAIEAVALDQTTWQDAALVG
jgi:D-threo-aldose 1-dehydrogenase